MITLRRLRGVPPHGQPVMAYWEQVLLWREQEVHLTPLEMRLLLLLASRPGITERWEVEHLLYVDRFDGGPEGAFTVVSVRVCTLRRKLRHFPLEILNHFGRGYELRPCLPRGYDLVWKYPHAYR